MGQYIRIHVDFDEFDDDDLADHLRSNGWTVIKGRAKSSHADGLTFEGGELDHISTLAVCGQSDAARELVISRVSEAIGRPL